MHRFRNLIPFQLAANGIVVMNIAVIVFHIMVLLKLVPIEVIWGGRLENEQQMVVFESVSIAVNALLIAIVASKRRLVQNSRPQQLVNVGLWVFIILFTLNTIGNLAAKTTTETLIATPVTFILALLCYRLVIEK